jgi:hypothetical protein
MATASPTALWGFLLLFVHFSNPNIAILLKRPSIKPTEMSNFAGNVHHFKMSNIFFLVSIVLSLSGQGLGDAGGELAALDFDTLIGGPMVAVINSQVQSAMATLDFVHSLMDSNGQVLNVQFEVRCCEWIA